MLKYRISLCLLLLFEVSFAVGDADTLLINYAIKSKEFLFADKDSAQWFLKKYLNEAIGMKDSFHMASAYKLHGIHQSIQSNFDSALSYYDSSEYILQGFGNERGIADLNNNRGLLHQQRGNHQVAIDYYLEALLVYEELQNERLIARNLMNIGNNYFQIGLFGKARKRFEEAIELFRKNNLTNQLISCYVGLGAIYNQTEKYDSALLIYNEALTVLEASERRGRSIILNNMGNVYCSVKNYEQAIDAYVKALKLKKQIGDKRGVLALLNNLANVYQMQGQILQAREYAEQGYVEAQALNDVHLLKDFTYKLFTINKLDGNHKESLGFLEKHMAIKDSLLDIDRASALAELDEKYENEKNTKRITELELQNQQATNERNLYIFGAVTLGLLALFLSIQVYQRKKSSKILTYKNDQINIALSEKETLLKEIHHRVKNNLQVVSSLLNLQANDLTNEAADAIKEGQLRVKSMALIHQKLYQENDITGIEVQGYLENLVKELLSSFGMTNKGILYDITASKIKLDVDTLVPLGLIINELITNSLKYAFQKSNEGLLSIHIDEQNAKLKVTISDNGVGMNATNSESTSFGWKMIKSLCRQLKAEMDVVTSAGTKVTLTVTRYKLIP